MVGVVCWVFSNKNHRRIMINIIIIVRIIPTLRKIVNIMRNILILKQIDSPMQSLPSQTSVSIFGLL